MVMDLQTGEATRYRTPVKGQMVRTPAVSPDGTKIIFQVFRNGAWLLHLADGSMQRVLTDQTAEEFAWSPDGRRVAFHSRRDGNWSIYVLWGS
jgi:Tol biopolymer transport system component